MFVVRGTYMAGGFICTDVSKGPALLTVRFTYSVGNGPGYAWDFGDGWEISHDQDPVHMLQDLWGVYEVTLQTWEMIGEIEYQNEFFSSGHPGHQTEPGNDVGMISPDTIADISRVLPSESLMAMRKRK